MRYTGELAALGSALCWTASALSIRAAGRHLGVLYITSFRTLLAIPLLALMLSILSGSPIPAPVAPWSLFLIVLSGWCGLVGGDLCLFRAYILIGPRQAMAVATIFPVITALIGVTLLGEHYSPLQWTGVFIAVSGVALAISEGEKTGNLRDGVMRERKTQGILFALGGAIGQSFSLVLAKKGMVGIDTLVAAEVRAVAAATAFLLIFSICGLWPKAKLAFRHRRSMAMIVISSVVGTCLGTALSLASVRLTKTGTAATLISLVPLFLIPPAILFEKEKLSYRAVVGAVATFAGISLLLSAS